MPSPKTPLQDSAAHAGSQPAPSAEPSAAESVEQLPRVFALGGLDPSGAAGILADVKTCQELGVFACGIATALTVQNQYGVSDVMSIPASLVGAEFDACHKDSPADVIKTGMLHSVDVVHMLADRVGQLGASARLVLDPVLRSSSGRELLSRDGQAAMVERLLPMAALITPNLEEAELLTGRQAHSVDEMSMLADFLLARGASAVLIKGGHLLERDSSLTEAVDLLRTIDGEEVRFSAERIAGPVRRGTGCTLAAAIAAHLAEGHTLRNAVEKAKDFVHAAMRHSASTSNVRALHLAAHRLAAR